MAQNSRKLVCVGDVTMDAFIVLQNAKVSEQPDKEHLWLCIPFADKIPYESLTISTAVGNASNVAVGAKRLGIDCAILTAIGGDDYGKQIMDWYKKEGVDTDLVRLNSDKPSNYHFVLNYKSERTILIKHQEYDYYDPIRMGPTDWIYFSSLGEHGMGLQEKLVEYLRNHPNVKMGFNPGTFQLKQGAEKLKEVYAHTHVLFVNRQEAEQILGTHKRNIKDLLAGLSQLGPKIVVITDGQAGAYIFEDNLHYFMPIYPDSKSPISRTGAGDAFATGFLSAIIYGLSVPQAAMWAPIEPMHVVQFFGAQTGLLTKPELLAFLEKAPKGYQPQII